MGLRFSHFAIEAIRAAGHAAEAVLVAKDPELIPVVALVKKAVRKAKRKAVAKRKAKAMRAPKQQ